MPTKHDKGIKGRCHCGRIQYEVAFLPERVTQCNCSICQRYAAVWGYYRRDEVMLTIADDARASYTCSDKVLEFVHCRHCGCMTHYEDLEKAPESRVALNFHMLDDLSWQSLPVRFFDGADRWQEIPG